MFESAKRRRVTQCKVEILLIEVYFQNKVLVDGNGACISDGRKEQMRAQRTAL